MIKVKHLMDEVEHDDGQRLWVEPIGLTRDMREWCSVHEVLPQFGPPIALWRLLETRPEEAYDYFRGRYHEHLAAGQLKPALQALAQAGMHENFTLLHQSLDREHNTATALRDFISELEAYIKPEE
jgi:uncharacterized protein YeaO (DUF488 family)